MNLTSPSQVKAWCIENGFHPNKTLGQNFLIDQNALKAIVDAGLEAREEVRGKRDEGRGEDEPIRVLEIGPGMGVLTEELLKRGCEVTAIEKDPVLAGRLAASLGNPPGLTVIPGDALDYLAAAKRCTACSVQRAACEAQTDESKNREIEKSINSFSCMVSNLPYQAGTRILLELVEAREIPSMTVLVQTEVAERLAAKEGSKTRGLAGVWAQLDYDVKIVRKVAASCFWPRPAIGSTVVTLKRHDRNIDLSAEERKLFHSLTKRAFEHRRKQLGSVFKDMIQSTLRAEELANEDWINLVKGLMQNEDA